MTPSRYWSGIVVKKKTKWCINFFTPCTTLSANGITRIGLALHKPLLLHKIGGKPKKKKKNLHRHLSWTKKTFDFEITSHHGALQRTLCDNVSWMFGWNIILGVILFLVYWFLQCHHRWACSEERNWLACELQILFGTCHITYMYECRKASSSIKVWRNFFSLEIDMSVTKTDFCFSGKKH